MFEYPSDDDIINTVMHCEESDEEEDDDRDEDIINMQTTSYQALEALEIVRMFIQGQSSVNESVFTSLNVIENFVEDVRAENMKQTMITDFFKS